MKRDEKQRRKKLKRKIWVAVAVLAMLGGFDAWTMKIAWVPTYGWQDNATADSSLIGIMASHGGMAFFFQGTLNIKATKGHLPAREYFDNYREWHFKIDTYGRYPYVADAPAAHNFRFVGFQMNCTSFHQVAGPVEWDERSYTVVLPMWVWALPPALLIVWWSLQLRRTGRKDSAFPVITE